MANEKISELTALTTPADADVLPVVDVSDTSVSITGQTKKITVDNLILSSTQTLTNKTLTDPVLNGTLSGTAFLDEDGMASDSAIAVASQQSIKKYVDDKVTAEDLDFAGDSGTGSVDLDSQTFTIDTGANLTTAAGSQTLTVNLDTTITGLTSVTSTDFVGDVTGDLTGNADTVTNGVYTTNNLSVLAATTSAQLAGVISDETGSGSLVFATSPTLVTPALGTPASGVATNLTGTAASLTAGTVTTNANLTGDVTSSGNATTYNNVIPVAKGGTTLTGFTAGDILYADTTTTLAKLAKGSDTEVLTLASGVPSWAAPTTGDITGVTAGTNLNGGGTSGTVTLNLDNPVVANLTGNASGSSGSCTGNAATVTNGVYTTNNLSVMAATTSAQLAGVISDETGSGSLVFASSPTLVTPALGTPASGVLTNCTGTASGLTAGTVTTNANLTGDVTSVGNATTIATDAVDIAMLSATGTASSSTFLRGDNAWETVTAGAAGSDGYVQYNNGGSALGGDADLFFDDTNKRLGVGTAIPQVDLHVDGTSYSNTACLVGQGSDGGYASRSVGGYAGAIAVEGSNVGGCSIGAVCTSDNVTAPTLAFGKTRHPTVARAVEDDDILGRIVFGGDDGSATGAGHAIATLGGIIELEVDGTVATGQVPGKFYFRNCNSSGSLRTSMVIMPSGNVGINVSGDDPDEMLEVNGRIHISGEVAAPSAPAAGQGGILYTKTDGKPYWISDDVAETDLSAGGGAMSVTTKATNEASTSVTENGQDQMVILNIPNLVQSTYTLNIPDPSAVPAGRKLQIVPLDIQASTGNNVVITAAGGKIVTTYSLIVTGTDVASLTASVYYYNGTGAGEAAVPLTLTSDGANYWVDGGDMDDSDGWDTQ